MTPLFDPRVEMPKATAVFAIRDAAGRHVAEHVRIERPGGEKTFAWRRSPSSPWRSGSPAGVRCPPRRGADLRWSELNFERACLSLPDSKTGAKLIPLARAWKETPS